MRKIKVKSYYRHISIGRKKTKRIHVISYSRRSPKISIARYEKIIREKKGIYRRKYGMELVKVLKKKGYTKEEIDKVKTYTYVGVRMRLEKEKGLPTKVSKDRKKVYIPKKGWIPVSRLDRSLKMREYWGRIKAYKDLMNISVKEARKLLSRMKADPSFRKELKKLVYPTSFKIL